MQSLLISFSKRIITVFLHIIADALKLCVHEPARVGRTHCRQPASVTGVIHLTSVLPPAPMNCSVIALHVLMRVPPCQGRQHLSDVAFAYMLPVRAPPQVGPVDRPNSADGMTAKSKPRSPGVIDRP